MMKCNYFYILVFALLLTSTNGLAQNDKAEVLQIVNEFFVTMKKNDSIGFNNLFVENAQAYSVRAERDSVFIRNSVLKAISSKDQLREKLREDGIKVHVNKNVAAVWAPYDFWINDEHSHCGYEVFTLIKNQNNWKIASLTYSVEKGSCKE